MRPIRHTFREARFARLLVLSVFLLGMAPSLAAGKMPPPTPAPIEVGGGDEPPWLTIVPAPVAPDDRDASLSATPASSPDVEALRPALAAPMANARPAPPDRLPAIWWSDLIRVFWMSWKR